MYTNKSLDTVEAFRAELGPAFSSEAGKVLFEFYKTWEQEFDITLCIDMKNMRLLWTETPSFQEVEETKLVTKIVCILPVGRTGRWLFLEEG